MSNNNIHVINKKSFNSEKIREILTKSNEIFEIDLLKPLPSPANYDVWVKHIMDDNGEITYYSINDNNDQKTEYSIAGFTFTYQRSSSLNQIHIWIAGCAKNFRRQGIMNSLFEVLENNAVNNTYSIITVNTYPTRFVNMPLFLASRNYTIETSDIKNDENGDLVEKLGYIKQL